MSELDIRTAVDQESNWKPDLIPLPLVNSYAQDNIDAVSSLVSDLGRSSFSINPADVIAASKWRYGRRPVALLPFLERALYRAVVNYLAEDLPLPERGSEQHNKFERAPLEDWTTSHVVVTDLANFYSSIPTADLCTELVHRTGRWEPIEWLRSFWLQVANGHNGIPQVSQPSDIAAEVYADELHRRVLRRGLQAFRYADDFRIAATGLDHAIQALEIFDEEARALGLFVNERKTYTPDRDTYEARLTENDKRLSGIAQDVRDNLTGFDIYSWEPVSPSDADVLTGSAQEILDFWTRERSGPNQTEPSVQQDIELARLVRMGLEILEVVKDPYGIPYCAELLRLEPQLTPTIARYMTTVAAHEKNQVIRATEDSIEKSSLTKWQRLWILHLLTTTAPATQGKAISDWTRWNSNDTSEYVRSVAIWALALNHDLKLDDWTEASRIASRLGGPYLAASLAGVHGISKKSNTLLSPDKLDRQVHKWADDQYFAPPF